MSVLTLNVDEVMRTLSAESANPFVVHDKEVDIVRFAINSGFADIVLDGQVALRVMYQRPGETEVRAQTLTYYDTDGLHNYYDWQLAQSDLAKNGSLMVALCILDISGGEVSEWHTTPCEVRVLSTIHTDDSDEGDDTITPTVKERVAVLESMIQRVASGAPIVVASTSDMTDANQIYVLSTNGRWYYHNGSAWVAGGEYGGVANGSVTTDKLADGAVTTAKIADGAITAGKIASGVVPAIDATLAQTGAAADAKVTGKAVADLKSAIAETDLIGNTYVYTASSGYQSVPISISAGKYKATATNCSTNMTFRDASGNVVSNIAIPLNANNYVFTITVSDAESIVAIRMYQGSVEIKKADNIITRVTALEAEIETKADVSALDTKQDKTKEFSPVDITVENGYINTNGNTYPSGQHFLVTVSDTTIRYKISGQHVNSSYPLLCEHKENGTVVFSYSGDAGAVTNYIFTPDSETAYFYVNATDGNGKCDVEEYVDTETLIDEKIAEAEAYTDSKVYFNIYDLRQDREARYELDKRNPFAWKPFDKAYFSWMNDDGRSDMYLYKDLCDTYNIPYANAVPWATIKNNTVTVDGVKIVPYCKGIIEDGGEIFTHAGNPLTENSTEAEILEFFRDGKKYIEDALESPVYGIIEAGGSGYSTFSKITGQKFCLAYYAFSDDYGTTPQYTLARTRIMRSSYNSDEAQVAAFKAVVDDAIANNKWVRFYCHGTDEVSISVLTSVFDYIATKVNNGDCAWTTWKNMYDTFRSSSLENRIAAVED